MQNLKTRFLLLLFMLLLNTSNFNMEPDVEIQSRLLIRLDDSWPGLVTNSDLTPEPKITEESITPAKTLAEANKKVDLD